MIPLDKEEKALELVQAGTPLRAVARMVEIARNTARRVARFGRVRPRREARVEGRGARVRVRGYCGTCHAWGWVPCVVCAARRQRRPRQLLFWTQGEEDSGERGVGSGEAGQEAGLELHEAEAARYAEIRRKKANAQ